MVFRGQKVPNMKIDECVISGAWVVNTGAFEDERGAFSRLFCSRELENIVGQRTVVQINHSKTHSVGAIRGLHFQNAPNAEMKIVRCLKGCVFDVALDLRSESPTFLNWAAVELTPDNHNSFVIPEGCAHGFQVLEENSELLYLHTAFYSPDDEGGIRFDDPMTGIEWPLEPTDLSARDLSHPLLTNNFKGIIL